MPTIRKLPSGRVNVQVRRDGHPPLSATFDNVTDAKAWARKIEGVIDQGKHYGFSRVRTLADAVDAFTLVQRAYTECAEGYGFKIDPCPPADPAKKGIVEAGVKYVKGNFLPTRSFRDLADLNVQARSW